MLSLCLESTGRHKKRQATDWNRTKSITCKACEELKVLPAYWVKAAAAAPSSCSLMRNRFKMIVQNRKAPTRKYGLTLEYQHVPKIL